MSPISPTLAQSLTREAQKKRGPLAIPRKDIHILRSSRLHASGVSSHTAPQGAELLATSVSLGINVIQYRCACALTEAV